VRKNRNDKAHSHNKIQKEKTGLEGRQPMSGEDEQTEQPTQGVPQWAPDPTRDTLLQQKYGDAELAKELLKVESKTATTKILKPRLDVEANLMRLKVEEDSNEFYEIITGDLTKSNLAPEEKKALLMVGGLSNQTQSISKALGVDLSPTQKMLAHDFMLICGASRGKGGWNAWLSKTDKSINQTSLEQVAKQLDENKKSRWRFW
jgi:hypothetical protein